MGWLQALFKVLGSSGTGLVSVVTIAKSIRTFKFLMASFSFVACLMILLALSLNEAWSFFMACNTLGLIVVWGVILIWSSMSSSKKLSSLF